MAMHGITSTRARRNPRFRFFLSGENREGGFTLLEIMMVLTIIGVFTAMAVSMGRKRLDEAKQIQTDAKLDKLEEALFNFRLRHRRLPCPAPQSIVEGDANYGVESANAGRCTGGTPAVDAAYFDSATTVAEGAMPFKTLGLPEEFMVDGWGNRFNYAVALRMTEPEAFEVYDAHETCAGITVQDASGGNRTTTAIYALVSYGSSAGGAFLRNGTRYAGTGSVDASSAANCNCDLNGAFDGTYNPTYVQKAYAVSGGNIFDDNVRFKERWHLQDDADHRIADYVGPELAVSFSGSPYVSFYSQSCDAYSAMAAPATLPTGNGTGVVVSPDNNYWAVTHLNSPYVTIYKRDATTGALTKLADPSTLPAGDAYSAAFSKNGDYLAVGSSGGTYLSIYKIDASTDTFTYLTGGAGPDTQPASIVSALDFSPDDHLLVAGTNTGGSDGIAVYRREGDIFVKIDMTGKIDVSGAPIQSVSFSPGGKYLAVGFENSPYLGVYRADYSTTVFTTVPDPGGIGDKAASVSFDRKSRYLTASWSNDPEEIYLYRLDPAANTYAYISGDIYSGHASTSVVFSPRQHRIAAGEGDEMGIIQYLPTDEYFSVQSSGLPSTPPGVYISDIAWRHALLRP